MSDILLTDVINGLAALILLFAFVLWPAVRMHPMVRAVHARIVGVGAAGRRGGLLHRGGPHLHRGHTDDRPEGRS